MTERTITTITFSERGNPQRHVIALPSAIGQFHQHMLDSIGGRHIEFGERRRRNAMVDVQGIPDIADLIQNMINEQAQPNAVDSIPTYKAEGEIGDCSICQETIKKGDTFRRLPCSETVNHCFHQTCIDPWLERNNTCPNCRCKLFN